VKEGTLQKRSKWALREKMTTLRELLIALDNMQREAQRAYEVVDNAWGQLYDMLQELEKDAG